MRACATERMHALRPSGWAIRPNSAKFICGTSHVVQQLHAQDTVLDI